MPLKRLLHLVLLLVGGLCAQGAQALCTVTCTCTVSTTSLIFSGYNPLSASNVDSTGNVRVACGGIAGLAIPYSVAISAGGGASMTNRQMASGINKLSYNLYVSSAYAAIWGDASGGTQTVSGGFLLDVLGSATPQDLTVYGRIPGGQTTVKPGSYTDTLVVTLTYY